MVKSEGMGWIGRVEDVPGTDCREATLVELFKSLTLAFFESTLVHISPGRLAEYALGRGWCKTDNYGEHSDVFTRAGWPELLIPRTAELGDYARVVTRIVEIFAEEAGEDEIAIFNALRDGVLE